MQRDQRYYSDKLGAVIKTSFTKEVFILLNTHPVSLVGVTWWWCFCSGSSGLRKRLTRKKTAYVAFYSLQELIFLVESF